MAFHAFRERFRHRSRDNEVTLHQPIPVEVLLNGRRIKSLDAALSVRMQYPLYCQVVRGGRAQSPFRCDTEAQFHGYARTVFDWKKVELVIRPL
jgi:hypothetical protein